MYVALVVLLVLWGAYTVLLGLRFSWVMVCWHYVSIMTYLPVQYAT